MNVNSSRSFTTRADASVDVAGRFEAGLAAGELVVHYQPIVGLADNAIVGVEALARWRGPDGLASPATFMPIAEAAGLMPAVDQAIIACVCRDAAQIPQSLPISVNLSTALVFSEDAVDSWQAILARAGLPRGRVVVEIGDALNRANGVQTAIALERLRRLGLDLALDDFGAGAVALADLAGYKFKGFKIDRRFVSTIDNDPQSFELVRAMAQIAYALGAKATAVGVESEEQARLAALAGCALAQGYLFAAPAPLGVFLKAHLQSRVFARAG